MDASYYVTGLQKICTVCGESLARAFRVYHACAETNHAKNLMKVFGIDISQDDPLVHPPNFCHKFQKQGVHSKGGELRWMGGTH